MQVIIDGFTQHAAKVAIGTVATVAMGAFISVMSAQIVTAGDLDLVIKTVDEVKDDVADIKESVSQLAKMQCLQQMYYFQDQVRVLEVTAVERNLTAVETQRKLYYQNSLNSLDCE